MIKKILLNEIEKSLYELGKIYIQNLNEVNKGIKTYTQLINRFSESKFFTGCIISTISTL